MNTNPALEMLSKDKISDNDVADYLESVNPAYDTLKRVKVQNTGKSDDEDFEIMENIKSENIGIISKLRNRDPLSDKEKYILVRTLEDLLVIVKFDTQHEFNSKGIEEYIRLFKN